MNGLAEHTLWQLLFLIPMQWTRYDYIVFFLSLCKDEWTMGMPSRESRFLDFFGFSISYSLQLMGENNSKTKVEKVFFFIFMSSYTEMSFLKIGHYGAQKSRMFTLISKQGFYLCI
jgi:hypothetical protein